MSSQGKPKRGDSVMAKSILLILISISFVIVGQVCLKLGMSNMGELSFGGLSEVASFLGKVATTPLIIFGFFLYVVASMIWLVVLSRVDLSFALPMMALSYVGVLVIAHFFLNENVTPLRWLGVSVICLGVFLLSRS